MFGVTQVHKTRILSVPFNECSMHTHAHTLIHIHTLTHTHIHAHSHTYAHTHTPAILVIQLEVLHGRNAHCLEGLKEEAFRVAYPNAAILKQKEYPAEESAIWY
jgi:hypothetical protein